MSEHQGGSRSPETSGRIAAAASGAVGTKPDPLAHPAGTATTIPPRTRRSRLVLWISVGAAASLAVFVAVLATSSQAGKASADSPLLGKPAPPISGPSLTNGRTHIDLSSFAGKWVLVNFAASWCIPCREEMPQLLAFAHQHARSGDAVVLSVAYDEGNVRGLGSYLQSEHADWPAVDDGRALVDYGVGGIPESYLIDPSGIVVAKIVGGVVAAQLDTLIARSSPATP